MQAMKEEEELHVKATAVCRRLTLAEITQTSSARFVLHTHFVFTLRLRVQTRPPLFMFSEAERRAGATGVGVPQLASHLRDSVLVLYQSTYDLWWTKWH
jgi:hypothetical protein